MYRSLGRGSLVTRSEFESAIKDALRHYTQADLLAGNALLHARLVTRSTAGAATPKVLRPRAAKGLGRQPAGAAGGGAADGTNSKRLILLLYNIFLNCWPEVKILSGTPF